MRYLKDFCLHDSLQMFKQRINDGDLINFQKFTSNSGNALFLKKTIVVNHSLRLHIYADNIGTK